jgi:polyhydroxybutyrate depolymerase
LIVMMPEKVISLVAASSVLALCAGGCATRFADGSFRDDFKLRTGIYGRSVLIHLPVGYVGTGRYPLVVMLHGAFSDAREMESTSGWSRLADREGFIVAYPEGIGLFGFLRHWNAGHCCGKAARDRWDDMAFLDAVIDRMCRRYAVDRRRVYMVGMSNGGMMTYRFASERAGSLAGIAVMSGAIGSRESPDVPEWRIPAPSGPVPALIMHGTADRSVPFDGGKRIDREDARVYQSVADAALFWRNANGATNGPVRRTTFGGCVTEESWSGRGESNEVRVCSLLDWGHVWPGAHATANLPAGHPFREFDAAAMIWEFFSRCWHAR